ncbi:hypothetical protein [Marinisporobacter balticus]|uniref:hypothetical protein n=1 Tax=Marinisporobacter balticus TaxID=2018667 RepID=UPI001404502E|nr:hypothetical protein [Marinisporobacter balticus]
MNIIKNKISERLYPIIICNFVEDDVAYLILRHQILYPVEYGLSSAFVNDVNMVVH